MSEIDKSLLRSVDESLVERYSSRLARFGEDPRTLGWDRRESQAARFAVAADSFPFRGKTVLDLGCGLADFLAFLRERGEAPAAYSGVDINPDLLRHCRERFPESDFHRANVLVDEVPEPRREVVVLFGVLNFRFKEFANRDFAKGMIRRAFELCREAVVVDMLSARRDEGYPEEDFVYYYDPSEILEFALELTPHVSFRHDYPSIPQREMMLILRKSPCR